MLAAGDGLPAKTARELDRRFGRVPGEVSDERFVARGPRAASPLAPRYGLDRGESQLAAGQA